MNFNDVAIVIFEGNGHRIYFLYISAAAAMHLLGNADLTEKVLHKN